MNTDCFLNSPELNPTAAGASGNLPIDLSQNWTGDVSVISKIPTLHTGIETLQLNNFLPLQESAKSRIHTTALDPGINIEIFTERISKLFHIYAKP